MTASHDHVPSRLAIRVLWVLAVAGLLMATTGCGGDDDGGGLTAGRSSGGGGGGGDGEFPDPQALGFDQGPDIMCANVGEVMIPRGYTPSLPDLETQGVTCRFFTPELSLTTDGSLKFTVNISLSTHDSTYDDFRDYFGSAEFESFPLGDEAFFVYEVPDSAQPTRAGMGARWGEYTLGIQMTGSVHHPYESGTEGLGPLPREAAYGEVTDIVTGLMGGTPGEPRITQIDLEPHPAFEALTMPSFAPDAGATEVCALVAPGADALGVPLTDSRDDDRTGHRRECEFKLDHDFGTIRNQTEHLTSYEISVEAVHWEPDFSQGEPIRAIDQLGRELQEDVRIFDVGTRADLYQLPIGDYGYLIVDRRTAEDGRMSGRVKASYADGTTHVVIDLSAIDMPVGGGHGPPTPEAMIDHLLTFTSALN